MVLRNKRPQHMVFPTDFKSEYWHRSKNIIKSYKNVVKHIKFMWFNYDHGNSYDFIKQPT